MAAAATILPMTRARFDALCMLSQHPMADILSEQLEWYSDEQEIVIATLFRDTTDNDICFVLLARDETRKYRAINVKCGFETLQLAWQEMKDAILLELRNENPGHFQGEKLAGGLDLFTPIVAEAKLSPTFRVLSESRGHSAARGILNEMMAHLEDSDGNLVEQFQSTAFDARLWELYLFACFREERLLVRRPKPAPDFQVRRFDLEAFVEAVIVGAKESPKVLVAKEPFTTLPLDQNELRSRLDNEVPIRFGSPLYSKLKKEYWKLEEVAGKPLIFAIADFHDSGSMTWTSTGLVEYLYGVRHQFHFDSSGNLVISPLTIENHQLGEKKIPSGFFYQKDAEQISAVMFSNSGTISKFTRLGTLAGFGSPDTKVYRFGVRHNLDPNAALPIPFHLEVVPGQYEENWSQGLQLFHNPNALHPVDLRLFPGIAHHRFVNGQIESVLPEFFPYTSWTNIFTLTE